MKKIIEIVIARIFLLLKKTIKLHPLVKVNLRTKFETHIKIYKHVDIRDSNIGCGTYINRGSVLRYAEIGRFCSIGPDVRIIYGKHPISEFISSHPAFFSTKKQAGFCFAEENLFSESSFKHNKSALLIGNDVWIGEGVRFLEGITVGDGAVIGAGALVTKDIEPYSVYGGIPARKIKMRFSPEEVKKLQSLKWWNRDFKWIKKNYLLFDSIDPICKEAENDSE